MDREQEARRQAALMRQAEATGQMPGHVFGRGHQALEAAAAEIERLRAEVEDAQQWHAIAQADLENQAGLVAQLDAEVARLREAATLLGRNLEHVTQQRDAAFADAARLREALLRAIQHGNSCVSAVCVDLSRENCVCGEEYRAALGEEGRS